MEESQIQHREKVFWEKDGIKRIKYYYYMQFRIEAWNVNFVSSSYLRTPLISKIFNSMRIGIGSSILFVGYYYGMPYKFCVHGNRTMDHCTVEEINYKTVAVMINLLGWESVLAAHEVGWFDTCGGSSILLYAKRVTFCDVCLWWLLVNAVYHILL